MDKNRRIEVMGIINITDNSYFSDSRCLGTDGNGDVSKIVGRAGQMLADGADILDIGACSTRPGSVAVGEKEEWRRLEPALRAIREAFPYVRISIDTYWASVVRKAFDLIGDFIVNDVTTGEGMASDGDPAGCNPLSEEPGEMLRVAGELGIPFIAMHMRGNPATMQSLTQYNDVTEDIISYFKAFEIKAEKAGVKDWIVDPGFGFAKTIDQNYQLLGELDKFSVFGRKILVGVSRKSMIYRRFNITPEESLPATQVLHYKALCNGAGILRVHDVAETVRTIAIYRSLEGIS